MTDRVQQMLDAVRETFEVSTRKPRLRRSKAGMRAEVRDGILKHPYFPSGAAPHVHGLRETQTGFSGPRHPDVWRDASAHDGAGARRTEKATGNDPADAALATLQAAKSDRRRKRHYQAEREGLSFDRPRMDDRPDRRAKGRPKLARGRKPKASGSVSPDSPGRLESQDDSGSVRRFGWIRALFGS